MRRLMASATAVVCLGLLAGCGGGQSAPPHSSAAAGRASDGGRPVPLHTPLPVPADTQAPAPTAPPCHGWGFYETDAVSESQEPVDCGPIPFATGTTTVSADGVPVAYTVADGDVWNIIAKRFDLGAAYLYGINAVRRTGIAVYPGDVINMDPSTITSVGSQDGVVADHTENLPEPHLPQR